MIKRFDSDTDTLGNRLDVVLQRGFSARVTKVRLDILDSRDLSHVRRAGASKHLVRDADDSGFLACFLEHPEEEIVCIDSGASRGGKDECVWGGIIADQSPPLKLRIDGDRKPDICVAALSLGFDLNAICDAAVDLETVCLL